jgi:hypothetical protein
MRGRGAVDRLKAFWEQPVANTEEATKAWVDGLANETDRAVIIVCTTIVEDALSAAIKARMPHLTSGEIKGLFGLDRAFGTFSRLIDVAYALQIIRQRERDSCHLLRELRNAAAHAQVHLDFDTPEIADVMRAFAGAELPNDRKLRRTGFIVLVATLAEIITHGVQAAFDRTAKWTEEVRAELHSSPNKPPK